MLLSALGFALMSACVKAVSAYHIPVLEIVAARALVSLIISYLDVKRKRISIWGNHKKGLFARGLIGALALMCVYYSVATLPLAEATILQFTNPVFTTILGFYFLKERVQLSTILCIIFSVLGLTVMVKPELFLGSHLALPWFSVGIALAGAFGSAIAYTLVRRLNETEDSSVIVFYFPLITLPISIALLGSDFVIPEKEALILLLFIGIFTQIGQVGLTKAMKSETAGKATAYSYVQIIFAVVLGWVFFDEVPTLLTWIGGGLILTGALINVFWRKD